MKALILDADKSLAALGGPDEIKEKFGFAPVVISGGLKQCNAIIKRIFERKKVNVEHDLFGDTGAVEEHLSLAEAPAQAGMEALIIDSLSVIGYQERHNIMKENRALTMDLQMWGIYGQRVIEFVHMLSRMDIPVVVTCHLDRSNDENGGPIEVPGLKGGSKTEAARFFDVIAYTRVNRGRKGEAQFVWQVVSDGRRSQAKSRLRYPTETGVIDQDFKTLIAHYKEQGIHAPKILVIGDAGSGKTTALGTLAAA